MHKTTTNLLPLPKVTPLGLNPKLNCKEFERTFRIYASKLGQGSLKRHQINPAINQGIRGTGAVTIDRDWNADHPPQLNAEGVLVPQPRIIPKIPDDLPGAAPLVVVVVLWFYSTTGFQYPRPSSVHRL